MESQWSEDEGAELRGIGIGGSEMVLMLGRGISHEFGLTVDGVTSTFEVPADPGDVTWPQQVPSLFDGLTFEWQPLDERCASPPPAPAPDASTEVPPTTNG